MRFGIRIVAAASLCLGLIGNSAAADTPVPLAKGVATLTPANTKIQFVCAHTGGKDPRTGGFAKFSGRAQVDPATKKLVSVSVEVETASLFTEFQKLTDHLKTADFFEVREYPTAKFESSKIVAGKEQQVTITGKLTLHGVTKEITIPATVEATDSGLLLKSEFNIDRSEFGMKFAPDKVENKVTMTVVVGEKTVPK